MTDVRTRAVACADYIRERIDPVPVLCIMTGTGLGACAGGVDVSASFDYDTLPYFPSTTVVSHAGRLAVGSLEGKPVLVFQGRFHLYEGLSAERVTIRVMQALVVTHLIVTNAAGGLNPGFASGDIMIIEDHINLTGENPLAGPNDDVLGDRFPDMSRAYDGALAEAARTAARGAGCRVRSGVYAGLKGPSLETPAEVRFLRTIGADAVGFSTVQEVIAAVHARMKILGLSAITNVHDPDHPEPASVAEILAVAGRLAPSLQAIVSGVIRRIDR
jgi:purine-nucleoside phosphorylase